MSYVNGGFATGILAHSEEFLSLQVAMLSSGQDMVTMKNLYTRVAAAEDPKTLTLEKCK